MKFSIPTNWDQSLISRIKYTDVDEIYAKLPKDVIGGGRVEFVLPQVSKHKVSGYVKEVHKNNLRFNYLLNSTCLGNSEWSLKVQRNIRNLLDWLEDTQVDNITVAIPYLLQIIKKHHPRFKVSISTFAGINSVQAAQYWQNLGADRITLSVHTTNRNFALLKAIRKNVKCELQLIANLHCLKDCPFYSYHGVASSHSSQLGRHGSRFVIDYCFIICSYLKLKNPVEFIRSNWIRPEDIRYYEEIGIERIKLVNRTMPTETIVRVVKAYVNRHHEGNLFDLFSDPTEAFILQKPSLMHKMKYFFNPFSINIFKLLKIRALISKTGIFIDNRLLDGFIEYFLKNDSCELKSCAECGYCDAVAKEAIKIKDGRFLSNLIAKYDAFLNALISGDIFKYF